jgi:hypothetical protein
MELHDIFPEVPIVEYSLYTFLALCLVGLTLLTLLYKLIKNRRKKLHPLHILEHYNPNDAKQTAHQISYYGKELAKSEAQKQYLAILEEKLDAFKYLKTSQPLGSELQKDVEKFIHSIRHKHV